MKQEKKRLTPIEKIEKINQQIDKLKQQQKNVQKTFESKITNLLKREKAFNYDFNVLYGGILELCQKLSDPKNHETDIKKFQKLGELALDKKQKNEKKENTKNKNDENSNTQQARKTLKPKYDLP
jgi:hypothetical protein